MYLEHFGLERPPFKITPDTSMFYSGNKRGAALKALKYAIHSGEGIVKVIGEVGSGKTMLCRMLEIELGNNIEMVYIANPSLSPDNILHVIAFELKLKINADTSKFEVMQILQNYLLNKHSHNKQVVVFVEEAQSMPIETLEEIRLLSNLETNDNKLLQMVLFGQPELDEKLRNHAIRQLKERITHNFYLDLFPAADVYSYLNFRMHAVGYRGTDLFSIKLAQNIERKSSGLTRRINILADKALLAAFSDGAHDIKSKHITLAAKDSDFGQKINWWPAVKGTVVFGVIFSAVWIGTLLPVSPPSIINSSPTNQSKTIDTQILNTQQSGLPKKNDRQLTNPPSIIKKLNTLPDILDKTQAWLINAKPDSFTIQLTLIDSGLKNDIQRFIEKNGPILNLQDLYIYKVSIRNHLFYSVIYGAFTERNLATQQLKTLPASLQKSAPYLRTIKGIKADIIKTERLK